MLSGMWDLLRPGLEPVSPALAGGFFTTELPGKPSSSHLDQKAKNKISNLLVYLQAPAQPPWPQSLRSSPSESPWLLVESQGPDASFSVVPVDAEMACASIKGHRFMSGLKGN